MPSYVIGNITIIDATKWLAYRSKVPETLVPWGGELILRGKKVEVLGGEYQHTDNVVIHFPNNEELNKWFYSEAYQELIPLRNEAADVDLISFEQE
jgi:uncharacterized protein (DUF1330 family)